MLDGRAKEASQLSGGLLQHTVPRGAQHAPEVSRVVSPLDGMDSCVITVVKEDYSCEAFGECCC